jgi:hypothetical protein
MVVGEQRSDVLKFFVHEILNFLFLVLYLVLRVHPPGPVTFQQPSLAELYLARQ